jgi:glyoxylase-like metal-dependent hydrolase (beta-lactamase superfamily II)
VVTPLLDTVGVLGPLAELYPDTELDEWAPYRGPYAELFAGDSWRLPCLCHLVREGGHTLLVDTGAGPPGMWQDWEPEEEALLLPELAAHGVEADDVDTVVITHVHVDHMGWNTDADGQAVFPKARYLLHEDALAAAHERADRPHIRRCVLAIEDRLETVVDGDQIAPGVRVVSLPGHDAGHIGLRVGDHALLTADAFPHPALFEHPEWRFAFDEDPALATQTRRRIVAELEEEDLVYMSHLPRAWTPSADKRPL